MFENDRDKMAESGKMTALTFALTKVLLLTIALGAVWLAKTIIFESGRLDALLRGFNIS